MPPRSQHAAGKSHLATAIQLCDGLEQALKSYEKSEDPREKRVHQLWSQEL